MMGWMIVVGHCYVCNRRFTFNATLVPSYSGEPICQKCIGEVNDSRRAAGLPLWPVLPGAYEPEEVA